MDRWTARQRHRYLGLQSGGQEREQDEYTEQDQKNVDDEKGRRRKRKTGRQVDRRDVYADK